MKSYHQLLSLAVTLIKLCLALNLDITNRMHKISWPKFSREKKTNLVSHTIEKSIQDAASTIAYGLMKQYTGNVTNTESTIAVLPPPYYWWESGAMWGAMVDYYHLTRDDSYVPVTLQALSSQVGPNKDFMVPLHVGDEGNDDQAFWGFAIMSAAERNFPHPISASFSWLELTENLWNSQVRRWDETHCGGGLRWQIFESNRGYDYKNTISNAAFFQLSARLARFTRNQTYAEWANKSYDWLVKTGLVDGFNYTAYDGIRVNDCRNMNTQVWTYNTAVLTYGSAVMYNYTIESHWAERTQGFVRAATRQFFGPPENHSAVMYEPACELSNSCNTDQLSFKAYLSRFLWATSLMAPFTMTELNVLTKSAQAAAKSCTGDEGSNEIKCGSKWYTDNNDGSHGVGQQMSALECIQGLLTAWRAAPIIGNSTLIS